MINTIGSQLRLLNQNHAAGTRNNGELGVGDCLGKKHKPFRRTIVNSGDNQGGEPDFFCK
ncbi:hypothetical protein [Larkinella terrae]|uniref:Uncharacterized protein n=1 Tax=Larkinella terrae TaxID=2025311 RepID=A0A7K0EMH9_9BACT|nr:hypothetical protein [Larkinella terrae]MRS63009.1 hypothetical protein [Larkinella terrae]